MLSTLCGSFAPRRDERSAERGGVVLLVCTALETAARDARSRVTGAPSRTADVRCTSKTTPPPVEGTAAERSAHLVPASSSGSLPAPRASRDSADDGAALAAAPSAGTYATDPEGGPAR